MVLLHLKATYSNGFTSSSLRQSAKANSSKVPQDLHEKNRLPDPRQRGNDLSQRESLGHLTSLKTFSPRKSASSNTSRSHMVRDAFCKLHRVKGAGRPRWVLMRLLASNGEGKLEGFGALVECSWALIGEAVKLHGRQQRQLGIV